MEYPYQTYKEKLLREEDVEKTMEDAEEAHVDGLLGWEQYGTLCALYKELTGDDF